MCPGGGGSETESGSGTGEILVWGHQGEEGEVTALQEAVDAFFGARLMPRSSATSRKVACGRPVGCARVFVIAGCGHTCLRGSMAGGVLATEVLSVVVTTGGYTDFVTGDLVHETVFPGDAS